MILTGAKCNDEKFNHIDHPRAETQIELIRIELKHPCTFGTHMY